MTKSTRKSKELHTVTRSEAEIAKRADRVMKRVMRGLKEEHITEAIGTIGDNAMLRSGYDPDKDFALWDRVYRAVWKRLHKEIGDAVVKEICI